jgi:hypothetical protein
MPSRRTCTGLREDVGVTALLGQRQKRASAPTAVLQKYAVEPLSGSRRPRLAKRATTQSVLIVSARIQGASVVLTIVAVSSWWPFAADTMRATTLVQGDFSCL